MSWLQCCISCLILSCSNENFLFPWYLQHLYSTSKLPPTFPFTNSSWNPSVHSHALLRTKYMLSTQLKAPSSSPILQDTSTYSFNTYTPQSSSKKQQLPTTHKSCHSGFTSVLKEEHTHTHTLSVFKNPPVIMFRPANLAGRIEMDREVPHLIATSFSLELKHYICITHASRVHK